MIRAPVPGLSQGERRLEGALAHYLVRVLRLRAGDAFVAFDPASAAEADATTMWADDGAITVRFGPLRPGAARTRRDVTWLQGLAKGDKVDAVVRDATEPLGPVLLAALAGTGALAFACGPEGGLEDREVDEARATGWTIASLGPLALRTETVAAAVLGAVRVFEGAAP